MKYQNPNLRDGQMMFGNIEERKIEIFNEELRFNNIEGRVERKIEKSQSSTSGKEEEAEAWPGFRDWWTNQYEKCVKKWWQIRFNETAIYVQRNGNYP